MTEANRGRERGGRERGRGRMVDPENDLNQRHRDPKDIEIEEQRQRIEELERRLALAENGDPIEEEESDSVTEEEEGGDNPCWNRGRNQGFRPRGQSTPTFGMKIEIPEFEGNSHPDEFVDWLQTVERVFDLKDIEDGQRVKLVARKGKSGHMVAEHDVDREARRNQQLRREVIRDRKVLVEEEKESDRNSDSLCVETDKPKSFKVTVSNFSYDLNDLFVSEDKSVVWDEYSDLGQETPIIWDEEPDYIDEKFVVVENLNKPVETELAAPEKLLSVPAGHADNGEFFWRTDREDVHMHIETALTDLVGEPAKKLHTARSRNGQVCTDFRLWCRDAIDAIVLRIKQLQVAMVKLAVKNEGLIVPGYTHLQRAQPVLFQHLLLAYVEQLERDASRILDRRARMTFSPLGACALAGTSLPIDRFMTYDALGFTAPMRNSVDAVSDRDFVLELLSANSITAVHLSRLGEEKVTEGSSLTEEK